jgi:hypothetical protein
MLVAPLRSGIGAAYGQAGSNPLVMRVPRRATGARSDVSAFYWHGTGAASKSVPLKDCVPSVRLPGEDPGAYLERKLRMADALGALAAGQVDWVALQSEGPPSASSAGGATQFVKHLRDYGEWFGPHPQSGAATPSAKARPGSKPGTPATGKGKKAAAAAATAAAAAAAAEAAAVAEAAGAAAGPSGLVPLDLGGHTGTGQTPPGGGQQVGLQPGGASGKDFARLAQKWMTKAEAGLKAAQSQRDGAGIQSEVLATSQTKLLMDSTIAAGEQKMIQIREEAEQKMIQIREVAEQKMIKTIEAGQKRVRAENKAVIEAGLEKIASDRDEANGKFDLSAAKQSLGAVVEAFRGLREEFEGGEEELPGSAAGGSGPRATPLPAAAGQDGERKRQRPPGSYPDRGGGDDTDAPPAKVRGGRSKRVT